MKSSTNKPSTFYAKAMLVVLLLNLALCFVLIGLYGLILIGAWQVLDALYWVFQGDKRRRPYAGLVVAYLSFLYWLGTSEGLGGISDIWIPFFFIIAPYGIAFWYWYLTHRHAHDTTDINSEEDPDVPILDSEFTKP